MWHFSGSQLATNNENCCADILYTTFVFKRQILVWRFKNGH